MLFRLASISRLTCAATLAALCLGFPARAAAPQQPEGAWVTTWASALQSIPDLPDPPPLYRTPDVSGRTVRQVVYPTVSGREARR